MVKRFFRQGRNGKKREMEKKLKCNLNYYFKKLIQGKNLLTLI